LGGRENAAAAGNVPGLVVDLCGSSGGGGVDAERPIRRGLVRGVGQGDKRNNEQEEDK
jgi:hypothetical protein